MQIKEIENLVTSLRVLPGVGEKTARRYAFDLIESGSDVTNQLVAALSDLDSLKKCNVCNGYSHQDVCSICLDEDRNKNHLVVVSKAQEILKVEDIMPNQYRFFALGGIIDPLNGVSSQDIKLAELKHHVIKNEIKLITLILPVTNEGEITASFIKRSMSDIDVKFDKIAQGAPVGSSLEYLDEITLIKSIQSAVEY
ncbi:recombination mediator RecR [Mollicutes bacterium LVI A0039]|nr:recombination mediator RecR [Mollicutes bacterium LVI A0039]